MSINTKALIAASLFASIGTVSTAAVAGELRFNERDERMIDIDYTDLNLNSPGGQRALEARISRAAKKVCGVNFNRVSLQEARTRSDCLKTCIDRANADLAIVLDRQNSARVAARADTGSAE